MSEVKQSILKYFNDNKQHILGDLLRFYNSVKVKDSSKLRLEDVNERELIIIHEQKRISIPIIPPMDNLDQWRTRLKRMANQSASAFGYSPVKLTKYRYPYMYNLLENGTQLGVAALVLFAFKPSLIPSVLQFVAPYRWKIVVATVVIHFFELWIFGLPLLRKYRVQSCARARWTVSILIEGFPALNRLKREIKSLEILKE